MGKQFFSFQVIICFHIPNFGTFFPGLSLNFVLRTEIHAFGLGMLGSFRPSVNSPIICHVLNPNSFLTLCCCGYFIIISFGVKINEPYTQVFLLWFTTSKFGVINQPLTSVILKLEKKILLKIYGC